VLVSCACVRYRARARELALHRASGLGLTRTRCDNLGFGFGLVGSVLVPPNFYIHIHIAGLYVELNNRVHALPTTYKVKGLAAEN